MKIELTPYQALQIVRWRTFTHDAVRDSETEKSDQDGFLEAIESINTQVRKNISFEEIDDAFAESAVKKLTSEQ